MAEKRMFTMKIIDSDAFLDMPLSAQALYFHLNMRADDDGFVNNPKKIQRMINGSEDDLKLLIAKRFILCFENGVIVIKHWRMHNLLRKDRYNPTQYLEEFHSLTIKQNGAYTDRAIEIPCENDCGNHLATNWQPTGNQVTPQVRIGKDSIEKDSKGKVRKEDVEKDAEKDVKERRIDYGDIVQMYNVHCPSLPSVRTISEARKKAIKARLHTYSVNDFKVLFQKAEASDFLKGKNNRNWSANFDWLIKDANMAKVLDGNYDNKTPSKLANMQQDMTDLDGIF